MSNKHHPRPLPNADGIIPELPAEVPQQAASSDPVAPPPAGPPPTAKAEELPPPPRAKTPIELMVDGIRVRRALVEKSPEEFPAATRTGLVGAQTEARDELIVMESMYAGYFKQAAVAAIVIGSPSATKSFIASAQEECAQPLVVVDANELYMRLARAAEPGLGSSRTFSAGQMGLVGQEMAAIGRSLFFSSLAPPKWGEDVLVPATEDLAAVIRKAVRASDDGDDLNRKYLRIQAYRKALEAEYATSMVPVMVINAQADEVEFLTTTLFNASTLVDLGDANATAPNARKALLRMRDIKAKQGNPLATSAQ